MLIREQKFPLKWEGGDCFKMLQFCFSPINKKARNLKCLSLPGYWVQPRVWIFTKYFKLDCSVNSISTTSIFIRVATGKTPSTVASSRAFYNWSVARECSKFSFPGECPALPNSTYQIQYQSRKFSCGFLFTNTWKVPPISTTFMLFINVFMSITKNGNVIW